MKERTALGEAILNHWRENRPEMVKELQKMKSLDRAVFEAQERVGDLLHDLTVVKKMNYQAAWEMVLEEWAEPPAPRRTSSSGKSSRRARPPRRRGTSG